MTRQLSVSNKNIFVTGIHTDIGKTLFSAILVECLQADYWKPIQAGNLRSSDTLVVKGLVSNSTSKFHAEAYRFETPASPHLAAENEGVRIDFDKMKLPDSNNRLIIEAAGGVYSPVSNDKVVLDLVRAFDCPTILVCNNYLGSINHSLLSIAALRSYNIPILGLVFNGPEVPSSVAFIVEHSGLPVVGHILQEEQIDKTVVLNYAHRFSERINELVK